jgi:hypothetical protein
MRHIIFARPVFAGAVAARSRRMPDPAATARLVAPPRFTQRPPTRVRCTIGAVDMAPIAIAADQCLGPAVWRRAQKKPGIRQVTLRATAAAAMRPTMAWTRATTAAKMPVQSCLCTVCGTAPKQNWPVMDRRRACLPILAVLAHQQQIPRGQSFPGSPSDPLPCVLARPGGPQGPPTPPLRCAQDAPLPERIPLWTGSQIILRQKTAHLDRHSHRLAGQSSDTTPNNWVTRDNRYYRR